MEKDIEEVHAYGLSYESEERTALEHFAQWLKKVPKDTRISITYSNKTIVFVRQDLINN